MKVDPKTKEFRAMVRKAVKDGTLTEKQLIDFVRSRRASHRQKEFKFEEIEKLIEKETGLKDAKE